MGYPERLESVAESFRLDGKVAVVTGGSRGIGRATALGLAEVGANVVVVGRNLDSLEVVAQEIRSMGREAFAVPAHVGKTEHLSGVVDQITREMGRIDVLVNNAGTNPAMSSMLDLEERLWDSTMNLNLKGLVFLSQAVARVLKEGGGGSIINVTSADGLQTRGRRWYVRNQQGRSDNGHEGHGSRMGSVRYPGKCGRPWSHSYTPWRFGLYGAARV